MTDEDALTAPLTDNAPGYSRVSPEKAALIVRLKRERPEITQKEIAQAIGVHQTTVSAWLQALDNDTVPEARKYAKSTALRAAMKLGEHLDHTDARVQQGAAKAITALAGVQEGSAVVTVGVQVVVGNTSSPAGPDPFDVIDSSPIKSDS